VLQHPGCPLRREADEQLLVQELEMDDIHAHVLNHFTVQWALREHRVGATLLWCKELFPLLFDLLRVLAVLLGQAAEDSGEPIHILSHTPDAPVKGHLRQLQAHDVAQVDAVLGVEGVGVLTGVEEDLAKEMTSCEMQSYDAMY
jgi:hypothetical protein